MTYQTYPGIRTPEDLGIACLGNPQTSIAHVSPENRIDRAEYGRKLHVAKALIGSGHIGHAQKPLQEERSGEEERHARCPRGY